MLWRLKINLIAYLSPANTISKERQYNNSMNTTSYSWEVCFDKFNAMDKMTRQILRRCAADRLSSQGAEEIGSSDISHELFAMWREANQNWQEALINEVEAFSNAS